MLGLIQGWVRDIEFQRSYWRAAAPVYITAIINTPLCARSPSAAESRCIIRGRTIIRNNGPFRRNTSWRERERERGEEINTIADKFAIGEKKSPPEIAFNARISPVACDQGQRGRPKVEKFRERIR